MRSTIGRKKSMRLKLLMMMMMMVMMMMMMLMNGLGRALEYRSSHG